MVFQFVITRNAWCELNITRCGISVRYKHDIVYQFDIIQYGISV